MDGCVIMLMYVTYIHMYIQLI